MPRLLPTLDRRRAPLAAPAAQRARLAALPLARSFDDCLGSTLRATGIDVLQINVGKRCNQTCRHCHVDAGPDRREMMSRAVMEDCLAVLDRVPISTVDITGGAPEMHPSFRWFVREVHARGRRIIDRCNLTILETWPMRDLPALFAELGIEVVCSLPHYRAPSTDAQRGDGVFAESIAALRRLNEVGYGAGDPARRLVLVTNPVGAYLPAKQRSLEREWKRELARLHGVTFDALYSITNMPISRYLEWLESTNNLEAYMTMLVGAFNSATVDGLMCRTTLSVAWDGTLHDCDFNQMLGMPVHGPQHIRDFDATALAHREIATDRHCFGCTAGAGSSCGGATT
ncbi:MAG: arsenosugar biosynthesis radical SAM protein ArsS [Myxococcota bacterium]|nr:arsenosugar biosynthesis radical SAM protein ArsS [Deltaproteobacteria bacterium]MDQ3339540.1 arsenosugar biosynthesis radical SAM protein ArsS [Myxococcota bacterium]